MKLRLKIHGYSFLINDEKVIVFNSNLLNWLTALGLEEGTGHPWKKDRSLLRQTKKFTRTRQDMGSSTAITAPINAVTGPKLA